MKNNIILKLLFGFLIVFLINSCKKYPEDPFISFKKPYSRIVGEWEITNVGVNNMDSTQAFFNSPNGPCLTVWKFEIGKGSFMGRADNIFSYPNCPKTVVGTFPWDLTPSDGKKEEMLVIVGSKKGIYPYWGAIGNYSKFGDWKILKLYKNTMRLKADFLYNTYIVTLKKIK